MLQKLHNIIMIYEDHKPVYFYVAVCNSALSSLVLINLT